MSERRDHSALVSAIVEALREAEPSVHACLSDDEKQWVKLAIQEQASRARIRQAIIEKTLASLVWAALVGAGYAIVNYVKAGLK